MLTQIPNALTLLRIALVPVIVVLLVEQAYGLALLVFAVAGVSDGLDGYIAKKYHLETDLGAILDPLADKLLLVATYLTLAMQSHLPMWLFILVAFRDLVILGGYGVLKALGETVAIKPSWSSKVNTFLQIILAVYLLASLASKHSSPVIETGLVLSMAVFCVWSGCGYVWQGIKRQ